MKGVRIIKYLDWEYSEKNKDKNKAFLLSGDGNVETIFVWDNDEYDFVSGDVFNCGSHHRQYDINNDEDISDLIKENLYIFDGDYVFKQYVKHDGSTHIWIKPDEEDEDKTIYYGNIDYQEWIRLPLFVQSIARHIHSGQYIDKDDTDVQKIKDIVFNQWNKKWNIVIVHEGKVNII